MKKRPQYLRILTIPGTSYRDVPIGPRGAIEPRPPELTFATFGRGSTGWLTCALRRSYLPPLALIDVLPNSRALARMKAALPSIEWKGHQAPLVLVSMGFAGDARMAEVESYAIEIAIRHLLAGKA